MKYYDELEIGELDLIEDNFISLSDNGVSVSVSQIDQNDHTQLWIKIYIEFGFEDDLSYINKAVNSATNRLSDRYHVIHKEDISPRSLMYSYPNLLSNITILLRKK